MIKADLRPQWMQNQMGYQPIGEERKFRVRNFLIKLGSLLDKV